MGVSEGMVDTTAIDLLVQPCSFDAVYSSKVKAAANMMKTFSKPFMTCMFLAINGKFSENER